MARFLCAGDLHLGAGPDLGREPGERLAEQAAVMRRIVDLANELEATILWAGDAWERRRPTPVELLGFREALHWLKFPLIGVVGNHDVEAWERPTGYHVLTIPGGRAEIHSGPKVVRAAGALVACLPWAPPGRLVALQDGGDRDRVNEQLAAGLVEIARMLYVEAREIQTTTPDSAIVLLAHWSVTGAATPTGIPTELFREPVLDAHALDAIGFDAIVLGHIHKPQVIDVLDAGDARPHRPMLYVGSPMPLNFGEAESDHGCYLLDVEPGDASAYFVPIESRRLVELELVGSIAVNPPEIEGLEGAIVKVKASVNEEEARRLDAGAIRRALEAGGVHKVWSVQVEVERAERIRTAEPLDETIEDERALELWLDAQTIGPPETFLELARNYFEEAAR